MKTPPHDTDDLLFTAPGGRRLDPSWFGHSVARFFIEAGLGRWSIHELRHCCASLLLAAGVPLEVVSEQLGHSSIRATKDMYGHLLPEARRAAADAIGRSLWGDEESPPSRPLGTTWLHKWLHGSIAGAGTPLRPAVTWAARVSNPAPWD